MNTWGAMNINMQEIQLQGETLKRVKTFTHPGSTLAED